MKTDATSQHTGDKERCAKAEDRTITAIDAQVALDSTYLNNADAFIQSIGDKIRGSTLGNSGDVNDLSLLSTGERIQLHSLATDLDRRAEKAAAPPAPVPADPPTDEVEGDKMDKELCATCAHGTKVSKENLNRVEQRYTHGKNAKTDILEVTATADGELTNIEVTGEAHDQGYAGRCSRMCGCASRRPRSAPRSPPCSTISPFFITQTRSANLRTMPRSWVMNI